MKNTKKIIPTVLGVGLGLGLGIGALSAEGASTKSGAYALMRRLFIKGGEAAADEAARQTINTGALYEEYELTTKGVEYWDLFKGKYRGMLLPNKYRSMWLDPVTFQQRFETHTNQVLETREPFYYVMHNRNFQCTSGGDPANSYDFTIHAKATYLAVDRVIKSEPGHEVLSHPFQYEFGLTSLAKDCYGGFTSEAFSEKGTRTVARDGNERIELLAPNADVRHLTAIYAPR
jgi:hypothetical protein